MRVQAWISINGLYSYDSTIFDGLTVPEGIDKNTVIDEICEECAELEILYPDPSFMKQAITHWSITRQQSWQRAYDALYAEFNPVENYDRYEDVKERNRGSNSTSSSSSSSASERTFPDTGMTETGQGSASGSGSGSSQGQSQRKAHIHGNIGVTTAPQMISEVLDKLVNRSIYELIINDFKRKFCVEVY